MEVVYPSQDAIKKEYQLLPLPTFSNNGNLFMRSKSTSLFSRRGTSGLSIICLSQTKRYLFRQKRLSQLCIITELSRIIFPQITIIGVDTVRENSGLAMSSRNHYLQPEELTVASQIYKQLQQCKKNLLNESSPSMKKWQQILNQTIDQLTKIGLQVDYLECRRQSDLQLVQSHNHGTRLFVACYLGKTRLIDNISLHEVE